MKDTETAASEVVAYVIIVAIVFTVFGLIFFNATSVFSAAGDTERFANAERGFEILQSDAEAVVFGGAPRRTTEVPLGGGSVSVGGEQVRVAVNVTDSGGTVLRNRTLAPLRYELDNDVLLYENGAVITTSRNGSAMASDPGWSVRNDAVTVHAVRTFGVGSVGGEVATVQMEAADDTFTEKISEGETGNVTIEIFSENTQAWGLYAEDLSSKDTVVGVTKEPNRVEVEMEIGADQSFVYVEKPVRVEVR